MAEPVFVVVNPSSGRGRGARVLEPLLAALAPLTVEHALTRAPGDEARLVEHAVARGFKTLVAVGGDGTWSQVGSAILRSGAPVRLGLVPGGTGCDLAKSLGIPARDVAGCARVVLAGHTRRIDVGHIEDRCFLNVAGFGYDVAVLEDSWTVTRLKGELLYLYCAVRQLRSFPGFSVAIGVDGQPEARRELLMLVVANARVFGGGFRIAPQADLADGRLDAMAFDNMGFWPRAAMIVRLLRGVHESTPQVSRLPGSDFRLRFQKPPAYETDGEWNQARSSELRITVEPAALEVLAPAPA